MGQCWETLVECIDGVWVYSSCHLEDGHEEDHEWVEESEPLL